MDKKSKIEKLHMVLDADDYPCYRLLLARELVREYPDFYNAYIQCATCLVELARFEEAESTLEQAIACCPKDKLAYPYIFEIV